MSKNGIIFVGFGKIARLFLSVTPREIPILGVVDLNSDCIITERRSRVFESTANLCSAGIQIDTPVNIPLEYYLELNNKKIIEELEIPTYHNLEDLLSADLPWNEVHYFYVCSPTEYHFNHVRQILEMVSDANILIEKPVCLGKEIAEMQSLSEQFPDAKIAVNENYTSSNLTNRVKQVMQEYGMTHNLEIYVEMTKNRIKDIEQGRFLDRTVLGYEIPHMITVTQHLLGVPLIEPKVLNVSELDRFGDIGTYQGSVKMSFQIQNGNKIIHYSAKDGKIGFVVPELVEEWKINKNKIPYGSEYRYRIIRIYDPDIDTEVIGQYEPLVEPGLGVQRGIARIIGKKRGIVGLDETFVDDTLRQHLTKCRKYFSGRHDNPFSVDEALEIVKLLYEAEKQILKN